jgi:urate oxidase
LYPHLRKASVSVDSEHLRWPRIQIVSRPHPHSFFRDGDDKRFTKVKVRPYLRSYLYAQVDASGETFVVTVTSGITDLLGAQPPALPFPALTPRPQNHRLELQKLFATNTRPSRTSTTASFSTAVGLSYTFAPVVLPAPTDSKKLAFTVPSAAADELGGSEWDADGVAQRAREGTLAVFVTDNSASVQVRAHPPPARSR